MSFLRTILTFLVVVGGATACQTQPDPSDVTLPTAANPIDAPTLEQSICSASTWPFATGAQWEFRDAADGSVYTVSSVVRAQSLTLELNDNTRILACTEAGIQGLYPAFLGSGHPLLGNGLTGEVTDGVLLPGGEPTGFWDQVVAVSGELTLPVDGEAAAYTVEGGRMVSLHSAQPAQTVTVAAGTYEVTPIREDALYEVTVTDSPLGPRRDVLINLGVMWYVADEVGPVRIAFEGGEVSTEEGRWPLPGGTVLDLHAVRFP